mmetsp:Transcript_14737/g.20886  ORF Transcript_14737/g.20886 Transcript_14737/m.20886 type:complete len:252 (+) Transcript_14737:2155-2910(+)
MNSRALCNGIIHKRLNKVALLIHHHSTAIDIISQWAPLAQSCHLIFDTIDKVSSDALIHKQPFNPTTILTTILKAATHSPRNNFIQLDIITKHHGILSTQFQHYRLQKWSSSPHHMPSHIGTSSKENLVNMRTLHKRLTSLCHTSTKLDQVWVKPILFQGRTTNGMKIHGTPRSVLGTLGDNAIPTEDSRQNVIEHVVKGVIPRSNNTEHSQWNIFHIGSFVHHHWINLTWRTFQPSLTMMQQCSNLFAGC